MNTVQIKSVIIVLILNSLLTQPVILWPNHDISTLKLLQIVHRHGDRTVTEMFPNDPFNNITEYWPEGIGELNNLGKYRMYKLGQFIRQEYGEYLGQDYSPREVFARSNAKSRCLESISALLAGAYPPNSKILKWNNGTEAILGDLWQPISIHSSWPIDEDRMLRTEALCPRATEETRKLLQIDEVQKLFNDNKDLLDNLSTIIGYKIKTLLHARNVHDHLVTEYERGYKWSDHGKWTSQYEQEIFNKLLPFAEMLWRVEWNNTIIQRTRAGLLIDELVKNIQSKLNAKNFTNNTPRLYAYSTQDTTIGVLLHALKIYNNKLVPLGATLLFELHKHADSQQLFTRTYYLNETFTERAHLMKLQSCDYLENCPMDTFIKLSKDLVPQDWNKECGISSNNSEFRSLL